MGVERRGEIVGRGSGRGRKEEVGVKRRRRRWGGIRMAFGSGRGGRGDVVRWLSASNDESGENKLNLMAAKFLGSTWRVFAKFPLTYGTGSSRFCQRNRLMYACLRSFKGEGRGCGERGGTRRGGCEIFWTAEASNACARRLWGENEIM